MREISANELFSLTGLHNRRAAADLARRPIVLPIYHRSDVSF
jgi:hypothetical protein